MKTSRAKNVLLVDLWDSFKNIHRIDAFNKLIFLEYFVFCTFCELCQNLQHMEKHWVLKYLFERNETL